MPPNTSYIKDGLKEFIIHTVDPSDLNDDPKCGLAEKEKEIAAITDSLLAAQLNDYDELEALVANTIGSNFTNFLLDNFEDAVIEYPVPSATISGDTNLTVGVPAIFVAHIDTKDFFKYSDFDNSWQVGKSGGSGASSSNEWTINDIQESSSSSSGDFTDIVEITINYDGVYILTFNVTVTKFDTDYTIPVSAMLVVT